MRVKNWEKFQHYHKRHPPWIKLHKRILDNRDFIALSPTSKALLMMTWVLASEGDGRVSCEINELRFRLRWASLKSEDLKPLFDKGFMECASTLLAESSKCLHSVSVSVSSSVSKVSNGGYPAEFTLFWEKYPNKTGKAAAHKAMLKILGWKTLIPKMVEALEWQMKSEKWAKDGGDYIPNPSTWLNQHRWEDEPPEKTEAGRPSYYDFMGMGKEPDDAAF